MAENLDPSVFQSDLVQIFVGPDRCVFNVHKALLCLRSPFFKKCLDVQSGFEESLRNSVDLPEDNPEAFAQVVMWAYTREVTRPFSISDVGERYDEERQASQEAITLLIDTYILANKLCMEELENKIIDLVREWHVDHGTSFRFLDKIIQMSLPACQMSKYLHAQSAYDLRLEARMVVTDRPRLLAEVDEVVREGKTWLLQVITDALRLEEKPTDPSHVEEDICHWHSHRLTPPCKVEDVLSL